MEADVSFVIPTDLQRCYIIAFKSTYLLCNGSWNILDNDFVNSRFLIVESENTQFFTFKRTTSRLEYNDAMKGRILRMTIGCYNKSNTIIPDCLLLKMQGTLKCPQFSLPPLPKPTTSPWTISPTSETGTSTNEFQTHSITTFQSTTMAFTKIVNKRKENADEENDGGNTGWIIGVAAGVFGLMLIIVAIVIIKRRRIKR
ncbi:uncharacterized protein LOC116292161 [Actinia tenebrosa]|uniref:Uncharacterized protein LOC116292161 n=1 Tax=Actinia tenebrosa TaxID=6105 RepID=A0A6P8HFU3_ACTTE|nr:uncharacterized protein LOC116292161 [Actinia tenebrosa]